GDAVVDLGDLVQRGRGVLRAQQDAALVAERGQAAAPGDALAGVVGPVLHHLLGGDVERHGHQASSPVVAPGAASMVGEAPAVEVDSGVLSRSTSERNRSATSASGTRSKPATVMVAMVG